MCQHLLSEVVSVLAAHLLLTQCLLFGFAYRMHHVTFITSGSRSHTGRMTWWALVHCLALHPNCGTCGGYLSLRDSPWLSWACLGLSQGLKGLCCGRIHDWGPGTARHTELQTAAYPTGRVMALCSEWGMGPLKPVHADFHELSWDSCSAGMAVQDVGVTSLKEASTSCFCLACKIVCIYCVILGWPGSLRDNIPALWLVGGPITMRVPVILISKVPPPTFYSLLWLNDLPQNCLDAKPIRQVLRKKSHHALSSATLTLYPHKHSKGMSH